MRFLIDAQLPPALAARLRAVGHEATHLVDIGLGAATDMAVWNYALKHQMIIVTKDSDFAVLLQNDQSFPGVIWIRLGNTTARVLWNMFEPLLPEIIEAFERGERLVEIV